MAADTLAKVGGFLATYTGLKAACNVVRTIGPFLLSQWEEASKAYTEHKARLALVETGKELLSKELADLAEVKKGLLEDYVGSTPRQRIRIEQDLDFVEGRIRQQNIGLQALANLKVTSDCEARQDAPPAGTEEPTISPHWMDKFNELARARNEDWRASLLARALAVEAAAPGKVSPRALWLLGTLEEKLFRDFQAMLDVCVELAGELLIPRVVDFGSQKISAGPEGRQAAIGELLFRLTEIGILGDHLTSQHSIQKGSRVLARYDSEHFIIEVSKGDLVTCGILLTSLGSSVASFCERTPNAHGKEIFLAWIQSLDKTSLTVTPVEPAGQDGYKILGPSLV